jgi:hypothetical protein
MIFSKLFPIIAVWEFTASAVGGLSMYLIAEFRDRAAAVEAIRVLCVGGTKPVDLDVFWEEPVEFRRGVLDRPNRTPLVAGSPAPNRGV